MPHLTVVPELKISQFKEKNHKPHAEALQTTHGMQDALWAASHFKVLVDYTFFQ